MKILKRLLVVAAIVLVSGALYLSSYVLLSSSFQRELTADKDTYVFSRVFQGRVSQFLYLPAAYLEASAMRYFPALSPSTSHLENENLPRILKVISFAGEHSFRASPTVPLTDEEIGQAFIGTWAKPPENNYFWGNASQVLTLQSDHTASLDTAGLADGKVYLIAGAPRGKWSNDRDRLSITFPSDTPEKTNSYTGERHGEDLYLRHQTDAGASEIAVFQSEKTAPWMSGKKEHLSLEQLRQMLTPHP